MATSLAPNNNRKNRKRKADEAQIDTPSEPHDLKRLKIVTPKKSAKPRSIIPNENTDASNETEAADSDFEKLLNASDSDIPESTPADDKRLEQQIPDTIPEEPSNAQSVQSDPADPITLSPLKPKEKEDQSKNPEINKTESSNDGFQWGLSNANAGFGSFGDSAKTGFGSGSGMGFGSFCDSNAKDADDGNKKDDNSARVGGWGTPREFAFSADSSNFSFAELNKTEKANKKKKGSGEKDKPQDFGFPAHFGEDPVAKLAGKEVDTGDASDETVFTMKGRIYELDTDTNQYKERGVGEVKLNTYSAGDNGKIKARLLCRREITFKTIMNAILTKDTKLDRATVKSVRFTVFEQQAGADGKEEEIVPKSYLIKLKEPDTTKMDKLIAEIEKVQEKM